MVTFAIVVDAALASLVSSIMENAVERTESSSFNLGVNWKSQVFVIFIIFPFVNIHISICWIFMNRIDPWSRASFFIRMCYVVYFLLSGMISLFIFIDYITWILWFIWMYLLFIWDLIRWPMRYS